MWSTNGGVLAEFTFQVQPGQAERYCWPILLSNAEVSVDGYRMLTLPDRQICFIGRDPIRPTLSGVTTGLSAAGFAFSLQGEPDVSYTIEASSDLVNWTPLYSTQSPNSSFDFVDPEAKHFAHRYYRAKAQ